VIDGLVVVDKPAGWTSHDVVAKLRRVFSIKRVGHAGTLDPDATGVLVLGLGRATRLMRFIEVHEKEYVADVVFGEETTTQDASGEVLATADAASISRADVERAAAGFVGEIEQIPPMVSAVKVGGERLYKKARRGEDVERTPRRVSITELRIEEFSPGPRARARLRVRCSRGTYIRTLAHDLGRALGVGGHVAALRRTRVGSFDEVGATTIDGIGEEKIRPMRDAVASYPHREVDTDAARAIVHGKPLPAFGVEGPYAILGPAGLVSMSEDRGDESRPICVVGMDV
jgi:tRNA pseudouridine55 synthase